MRFASRERPIVGQPEVGAGVIPGTGGTERLPLLVGRGRALEIVLGANDFDGDTAERYGYVNRALQTKSWTVSLTNSLAASRRSIGGPSRRRNTLVNDVSLPSVDRLLDARNAFATALTWPETQQRIRMLFKLGLQQEGDLENRFGAHLAALVDTTGVAVTEWRHFSYRHSCQDDA